MGKYHEELGIDGTLTWSKDEAAIKKAYRALAKKYHPDRDSSEEAKKKFLAVTEAYEGLQKGRTGPNIDADARDHMRNHFGMDPMDVIREAARNGQVFSQMTREAMNQKITVVQKMKLPVKLFLRGGETVVEYNTPNMDRPGVFYYEHHTKKITIPPNSKVGDVLEFPGDGPRNPKGEAGDLIIQLFAGDDGPYEIHNGIDIVANVRLTVFELMAGTTKRVLHPDGRTKIEVVFDPNSAKNGVLSNLGNGLVAADGSVGDFLLQIHPTFPHLNSKQIAVLKQAVEEIEKLEGAVDETVNSDEDEIEIQS